MQRWNDLVGKLLGAEASLQSKTDKQELAEYERNKHEEAALLQTMVKAASRDILSVPFNAWQFEDAKQTWAGLASAISGKIEKALPWHLRQLLRLSYAWQERRSELILNILLPLSVVLFVAALVIFGFFQHIVTPEKIEGGWGTLIRILLPASSALFTVWLVSSQILKVAEPVSDRVLSYIRLPNYREQMGFQHRVKDDLKFAYKFLTARRPGCRVIVYIDDLDRCSENKIMELLQAINLILASCEFFVFVGMDTEMIYRAIKSYYQNNVSERFPEDYLSKIIQISFFLPATTLPTRAAYVNTLFSAAARLDLRSRAVRDNSQTKPGPVNEQPVPQAALAYDLAGLQKIVPVQLKEAEDTADELSAFADYATFLDDNPREIKRLINIHRLIKILLQKQNTSWSSERQRKLVKWLIFCDRWPDLVDDVLRLRNERPPAPDCLGKLVKDLELQMEQNRGTDKLTLPDQLKEFALFPNEQNVLDVLSAPDMDDDFRLASDLSQLVKKSPALRARAPLSPIDGALANRPQAAQNSPSAQRA